MRTIFGEFKFRKVLLGNLQGQIRANFRSNLKKKQNAKNLKKKVYQKSKFFGQKSKSFSKIEILGQA